MALALTAVALLSPTAACAAECEPLPRLRHDHAAGRRQRPRRLRREPGIVSVQTKRATTTLSTRRADLRRDCTFSLTLSFSSARRFGSARSLRVTPRFLGNAIMTPAGFPALTARVR